MVETIGVDLGGTKMLVGVVNHENEVLRRAVAPSVGLPQQEILDVLARELGEGRDAFPGITGAGLGIPCTIDRDAGVAINAVNLDLADVPIRDLMTERLGLPVFVDNDANAAMLAEHRFGAAQGARNAVMLTIGTGIGGGLIVDGRLFRGGQGAAAEPGLMVVDLDGPPCQGNCPNRGCLEAMASGTALEREAEAIAARSPGSELGRGDGAGRPVR